MNQKDVFLEIDHIEEQVGNIHVDLGLLKQKVVQLLEENKRLSIENQQLRKLLKRESVHEHEPQGAIHKSAHVVGEGYDNLARLYHEGFHICNVYYGHLRTEGDCLFCLSFLNK